MQPKLIRKITLQITPDIRDKVDSERRRYNQEHPDLKQVSNSDIVMGILEKALKDVVVIPMAVPGSRAKYTELAPHERLKMERGEWIGVFPYGYKVGPARRAGRTQIPGTVTIDEDKAAILKLAFEYYATGNYSIDMLSYRLKKDHNVDFASNSINERFSNKFYIGIMKWRGQEFPHKYPTFISQELFDQVQAIAQRNRKTSKYGIETYWLKRDRPVTKRKTRQKPLPKPIPKPQATDPFLQFFISPISFEGLVEKTGLSSDDLRQKLLEYEIQGLIAEIGPSLWAKK